MHALCKHVQCSISLSILTCPRSVGVRIVSIIYVAVAVVTVTGFPVSTVSDSIVAPCNAGSAEADAVLLIFTLAAVDPQDMAAMLDTAFQVSQPCSNSKLDADVSLFRRTHLLKEPCRCQSVPPLPPPPNLPPTDPVLRDQIRCTPLLTGC